MNIAFIYAGQGSQKVGMGKDFYEEYPSFRETFDNAPVDFDLKSLCFDGPDEQLSQTQYTQPCMVAFAAAVTDILKAEGIEPKMAAGLSLGEYSALYAAGVFDKQTVISLAAFRGNAMTNAVSGLECGMVAVMGLDREPLLKACEEASSLGVVQICNYNCPGQLVISGEAAAVSKAAELASAAGAKRCVPLKVSGPFHTSLMTPAGDALREKFNDVNFGEMQIPVVFNAIGREKNDGETIPQLLEKQVQSSVYFEDSIRYMTEHGIDTFVEIGPGKTLSGFVKKIVKGVKIYNIDDAAGLKAVVAAIKEDAE
ncbi:MAG: ACP S-malonyltransferase [Firmicutes bacterium]|nr:ACP S-malonyltransferase [Bacillota bacterium]